MFSTHVTGQPPPFLLPELPSFTSTNMCFSRTFSSVSLSPRSLVMSFPVRSSLCSSPVFLEITKSDGKKIRSPCFPLLDARIHGDSSSEAWPFFPSWFYFEPQNRLPVSLARVSVYILIRASSPPSGWETPWTIKFIFLFLRPQISLVTYGLSL